MVQQRSGFLYNDVNHNTDDRYPKNFGTLVSPEKLEILEVGCARGVVTRQLLEFFPNSRVTAIDMCGEMVNETSRVTRIYGDRVRVFEADGYFLVTEMKKVLGEVPEFDRVLMMNNLWYGANGSQVLGTQGMSLYRLRMIGENTVPVIKDGGVWDITHYANVLRLQRQGNKLVVKKKKFHRNLGLERLVVALTKRPYR